MYINVLYFVENEVQNTLAVKFAKISPKYLFVLTLKIRISNEKQPGFRSCNYKISRPGSCVDVSIIIKANTDTNLYWHASKVTKDKIYDLK